MIPLLTRLRATQTAGTDMCCDDIDRAAYLVNPDGPQAAAAIDRLCEALARWINIATLSGVSAKYGSIDPMEHALAESQDALIFLDELEAELSK